MLELDAHCPWVVKEPRLSLLFPLVRPLLEVPVCIHVTREPLEIANSLHTRNGFPPPAGLALWELYSLRALDASAGLPRVHVRYEDVVLAPVATLAQLVERLTDLGVFGLRVPTEREITAYIDADLHREHRPPRDRPLWMNEQQMQLAAALDDGSALNESNVPRDLSEGARAQLGTFEDDWAQRARADQLQRDADVTRANLDHADRQLQRLAGSRTWRIAWGAQAARRRLARAEVEPPSDPLQRIRGIIDQARRQLAAEAVPTPTDPQALRRDDGPE